MNFSGCFGSKGTEGGFGGSSGCHLHGNASQTNTKAHDRASCGEMVGV
jgi:hypothetical protein